SCSPRHRPPSSTRPFRHHASCGPGQCRSRNCAPSRETSMQADETSTGTTYNVLFVCTGNTCRSPLAEAIARAALEARGWTHVRVDSAGTAAAWDLPASENAAAVAAEHGLDLSGHRSQPVTPELVRWADLILVMSS